MTNMTINEVPECKLVITKIKAILNNKNFNVVDKFIFMTDKGDMSLKLTSEKIEYIDGIETQKTVSISLNEVPEKIKNFSKTIKEKGKIEIVGTYNILEKEIDGEIVKYKFISKNNFKEWK